VAILEATAHGRVVGVSGEIHEFNGDVDELLGIPEGKEDFTTILFLTLVEGISETLSDIVKIRIFAVEDSVYVGFDDVFGFVVFSQELFAFAGVGFLGSGIVQTGSIGKGKNVLQDLFHRYMLLICKMIIGWGFFRHYIISGKKQQETDKRICLLAPLQRDAC
jgi:hypothetical protein